MVIYNTSALLIDLRKRYLPTVLFAVIQLVVEYTSRSRGLGGLQNKDTTRVYGWDLTASTPIPKWTLPYEMSKLRAYRDYNKDTWNNKQYFHCSMLPDVRKVMQFYI